MISVVHDIWRWCHRHMGGRIYNGLTGKKKTVVVQVCVYTLVVFVFDKYWEGGTIMEMVMVDWYQTTLYTRVLVNATNWMKKSPIPRCTFLHQYYIFSLDHYTQHPFNLAVGYIYI